MNGQDIEEEDAVFRGQARRAAQAVLWVLRVLFAVFVGVVLCLSGMAFTHFLLPWIGVPVCSLGILTIFYGVWWGAVGRFRCLTCPVCGVRGHITKDEWAYFFHCPRCGRTADTGIGIRRRGMW